MVFWKAAEAEIGAVLFITTGNCDIYANFQEVRIHRGDWGTVDLDIFIYGLPRRDVYMLVFVGVGLAFLTDCPDIHRCC